MTDGKPMVLVVDDERELADLYTAWLREEYVVQTAYGGREAVDAIGADVDVALVDRMMPGLTGDEVLRYVRDGGYNCRVAIVTAVEPDFEIIEMGFDEYVVKPVTRDALSAVVGSLVTRSKYDEKVQEFFSLASKRAALEAGKDLFDLESSDAYGELLSEFDRLRSELERTADEMTDRDFEIEMRRVSAE